MGKPKNLHPVVEYSSSSYIPEIDDELSEFMTLHHEDMDSSFFHEALGESGGAHTGELVKITDDIHIDHSQFEEMKEEPKEKKRRFFLL